MGARPRPTLKGDCSAINCRFKEAAMLNTGKLAGKTIFITGASRGIGKAIALKAARDGANIVVAAKTAEPHPKLPGTIYSAAKERHFHSDAFKGVRDYSTGSSSVYENVPQVFERIETICNEEIVKQVGSTHEAGRYHHHERADRAQDLQPRAEGRGRLHDGPDQGPGGPRQGLRPREGFGGCEGRSSQRRTISRVKLHKGEISPT